MIEKVKIFKLTIVNFLVGNEDMHLKNFSLITHKGKTELSPNYDLLNTTIAIKNITEEIALPINGKKNRLNKEILIEYFGSEVLNLNQKTIQQILEVIFGAKNSYHDLIEISFLTNEMKEKYLQLLKERWERIYV